MNFRGIFLHVTSLAVSEYAKPGCSATGVLKWLDYPEFGSALVRKYLL